VTAAPEIYGSSPVKPLRRSKSEIELLKAALYDVVQANQPVTVRQVFYQMVSRGEIDKTENEYKHTVGRLLTEMRLYEGLPYGWLVDTTRRMRKPWTSSSMESALKWTAELYRRSLWDNQEVYVEIWLEKDALSGVLYEVTGEWDVPLMVTRGYSSLTFLHDAAEAIYRADKPTYLYYFGDYDPSGVDISRVTEERLREFAPDADITFERVAVNQEQIRQMDLLTRPTKGKDTRNKSFQGESVEVDAIPPVTLRAMAEECITQHIDQHMLMVTRAAEESEREWLWWRAALS
jgi:hypothetical protein